MAGHTKGPWEVGKGAGYYIRRPNDRTAFAVGITSDVTLVDSPYDIESENRANAYLMAAAPDLLDAAKAALHQLISELEEIGVETDDDDLVIKLRAAISKAEG